MSAKLNLAAAAALLTVLSVQGPAFAQSQHKSTIHHVKTQLPADAYGSAGPARAARPSTGAGYGSDPDPSIRFEMNRDRGGAESASGAGGNG